MKHRRHYTLKEARELIPQLEVWLSDLLLLSQSQVRYGSWQKAMFAQGYDLGGMAANTSIKELHRLKSIMNRLKANDLVLVDLQKGRVDFPSLLGGKEVYLSWEKGETDITHWHEVSSHYC
ncbi:MAG: DUF2203 family protein [Verrucomicrobiales bacterium]